MPNSVDQQVERRRLVSKPANFIRKRELINVLEWVSKKKLGILIFLSPALETVLKSYILHLF
jgi:hypothetical protein